jgi:hypothetical protein
MIKMNTRTFIFLTVITLVLAGISTMSQTYSFPGKSAVCKNSSQEVILPDGEFEVNPELINGSAAFSQTSPSVAFNGLVYLVVWTDNRNMLDNDIYGARLDANGLLIDPAGIIICKAPGNQKNPAVESNGDIFLVVWEDERNSELTGTDIYGTRVNGSGIVMNPDSFVISNAADLQEAPKVRSADENFFVVWSDHRTGTNNDIYGTFVSAAGNVTPDEGLAICTQTSWQGYPDICVDASRYFVVWADQRGFSKDIYGSFIKTDGTISHTNGLGLVTMFNNQNYPSVVWGGTQFFLAWEEDQTNAKTKIYGSRLSASGALLDAGGIVIGNSADLYCQEPDAAFDGTNFTVTFSKGIYEDVNDYDIIASRINSSGQVLDPAGMIIAGGGTIQKAPAILFDGENYLLAWDDHTGNDQINAAFVDTSGVVSPAEGFLVSGGYNDQLFGDVAFDGTNYMAVWCDTRNEISMNIFAARINDQGLVLDQQAIAITTGEEDCFDPDIAFNGTNYLVVWDKGSDIYGARLSLAGAVLDPNGFVIYQDTLSQNKPAVASDGQNWMVVWEDGRNSTAEKESDIYGTVITSGGTVLQPLSIPILVYTMDQINPDIIYDSTNYIVVWQDYRAGIAGTANIYGTRIALDGTVLDNNGKGIVVDETSPMMDPSLAFDGTNLMVSWTGGFYPEYGIKSIRFNKELVAQDIQPIALSTGTDNQHNAGICFNGEIYMILWMDYFDGLTYRIDMAKVATDGTIAETGVFSELDGHLSYPVIIKGPLKQVMGVFSAFTDSIGTNPVNSTRLLGKLIGQGQGPGIAEHHSEEYVKEARLWPNPATSEVTVGFELIRPAYVNITINDTRGKLIKEVAGNKFVKGAYTLETGTDHLAPGVYFVILKAGEQSVSLKLLVK